MLLVISQLLVNLYNEKSKGNFHYINLRNFMNNPEKFEVPSYYYNVKVTKPKSPKCSTETERSDTKTQ